MARGISAVTRYSISVLHFIGTAAEAALSPRIGSIQQEVWSSISDFNLALALRCFNYRN